MCTAHMYLGYGSFAVSLPAWVLGVRFAYFYIESGDLVPNIEMASAWASALGQHDGLHSFMHQYGSTDI